MVAEDTRSLTRPRGIVQFDPTAVVPEVVGVEGVGLPLAVVAKEQVESAGHRIGVASRRSQAPLAEPTGGLAGIGLIPGATG